MDKVICACGCGLETDAVDAKGRPKKYVRGHNRYTMTGRPLDDIVCPCGATEKRNAKRRGAKGLCYKCYHREYEKKALAENGPVLRQRRRNKIREKRLRFIEMYGGECECCGETTYEFLALDHIHGGGRKHRMEKSSHQIYTDALTNPQGKKLYRVLCHNCNQAKGLYGYCPHEHCRTKEIDAQSRSCENPS